MHFMSKCISVEHFILLKRNKEKTYEKNFDKQTYSVQLLINYRNKYVPAIYNLLMLKETFFYKIPHFLFSKSFQL